MGLLLLPLHGALFFVSLAAHVLVVVALIDAALQKEQGYIAADKQTKVFWLMALVISFFIIFIGVIAAIVYFVDVRPAVRQASGGPDRPRPSSSDGPYGPFRG
jgi:heme/copper-type cytochrome/quinol oxidase subunit 2